MTLRLQLVHLAWDGVANSTGYDILLDSSTIANAGPRARTTKILIPGGASHRVRVRAKPSGVEQAAQFEWSSVTAPPPPPVGYTDADLSRRPAAPQNPATVSLSSPRTISGVVTDTVFDVTASMGTAVVVPAGARLERCVINCNGRAANGVSGAGTVKDVLVTGATDSGFSGVRNYEGCCRSSRNTKGFRLTGSGLTSPADCLLISDDDRDFGIYLRDLADSHFLGALAAINTGKTGGDPQATGIECWANVHDCEFNILISNANPGYGVAIYGSGTFNNTVKEILCLALDRGGDPALSIGGGAHDNTIDKMYADGYAVGCIMGEDVNPSPFNNRVVRLEVRNSSYPAVIFDRGAHHNVVENAVLTNCGSAGADYLGAISIFNRGGAGIPHDNQVLGLVQSGTQTRPEYAVYLGAGTSGNVVRGSATSWSVGKVKNDGSGNTVDV